MFDFLTIKNQIGKIVNPVPNAVITSFPIQINDFWLMDVTKNKIINLRIFLKDLLTIRCQPVEPGLIDFFKAGIFMCNPAFVRPE